MEVKISIVDDSLMMRSFLSHLCTKIGQVQSYEDPKRFLLDIAAGHIPDILILDLNLPQIHGIEILENLQRLTEAKKISILVVSSSDQSSERIKCLELGASDFLMKPFNPKEFELRLKRLIPTTSSTPTFKNLRLA